MLISPVLGWTDTGHMLTAKIAALGLKPEVLDFLHNITDNLYTPEAKRAREGRGCVCKKP